MAAALIAAARGRPSWLADPSTGNSSNRDRTRGAWSIASFVKRASKNLCSGRKFAAERPSPGENLSKENILSKRW
jgi:hypothetical protein